MEKYSETEKKVLTQLQQGVKPVSRPFQGLALPEAGVIGLLKRAQADGLIRRFGAVFDARRLGYKSMLCALDCGRAEMEAKAAIICAHPGVTHCYERRPLIGGNHYPALWFTLAILHDQFDQGLADLRQQLEAPGPKTPSRNSRLLELPALRRFKIDVLFNLQNRERDEQFPGAAPAQAGVASEESFRSFTESERMLVRALDQQIPVTERPFVLVARELGTSEDAILATLQTWQREGVLRRIAAVLYHRETGFKANAMCVWPVEGDVLAAGRRVAGRSEVTHCYQRSRLEAFPFDLYAMIHTSSWPQTKALFEEISGVCGLSNGELFGSFREFKKSSMQYFR